MQEPTLAERVRALRWYADRYDECADYWRRRPPASGDTYQLDRHQKAALKCRAEAAALEAT